MENAEAFNSKANNTKYSKYKAKHLTLLYNCPILKSERKKNGTGNGEFQNG